MRRTFSKKWVDYLTAQPESGMGYQRVDVRFDDGTLAEDCLAFNAEELEVTDACATKRIVDIKLHEGDTQQAN